MGDGETGGVTHASYNHRLWCTVDGEVRQDGSTSDMIFPVPRLIEVTKGSVSGHLLDPWRYSSIFSSVHQSDLHVGGG